MKRADIHKGDAVIYWKSAEKWDPAKYLHLAQRVVVIEEPVLQARAQYSWRKDTWIKPVVRFPHQPQFRSFATEAEARAFVAKEGTDEMEVEQSPYLHRHPWRVKWFVDQDRTVDVRYLRGPWTEECDRVQAAHRLAEAERQAEAERERAERKAAQEAQAAEQNRRRALREAAAVEMRTTLGWSEHDQRIGAYYDETIDAAVPRLQLSWDGSQNILFVADLLGLKEES